MHVQDDTTPPPSVAPLVLENGGASADQTGAAVMPGKNGGWLRRGNPGNRGPAKSALAKEILEASTPRAAMILRQMALKGVDDKGAELSHGDRLKALQAALDRGGVPVRSEIAGTPGAPFVVAVTAARPAEAGD